MADEQVNNILIAVLALILAVVVIYIISQQFFNAALNGLLYYIGSLLIFLFLVMLIGSIYQYTWIRGKPLIGFFSFMFKHWDKNKIPIVGQKIFYMREQFLLRLDMLVPIGALFYFFLYYTTLPIITTINYNDMEFYVTIITSLFTISYMVYSLIILVVLYFSYDVNEKDRKDKFIKEAVGLGAGAGAT